MRLLKRRFKQYPNLIIFLKSPLNWLYAGYLTLRFVDKWNQFPAFAITGKMPFKDIKKRNSTLIINTKLNIHSFLQGRKVTSIVLAEDLVLIVDREFSIGDGVQISLAKGAKLILKGKRYESSSGITSDSKIMVNKLVEIGNDCIIAWDTFITDSDWHTIAGKIHTEPTILGDHVWIGIGAKILKGTKLQNDCIVTSSSVVLRGDYKEKSLLSGNPAKIIKSDIPNWTREIN